MVIANVPKGKKVGRHLGRVACRQTGSFNIQTATEVVQGISYRYCKAIYRTHLGSMGFIANLLSMSRTKQRLTLAAAFLRVLFLRNASQTKFLTKLLDLSILEFVLSITHLAFTGIEPI